MHINIRVLLAAALMPAVLTGCFESTPCSSSLVRSGEADASSVFSSCSGKARDGDAIAQNNLGDFYYYGLGVPKDVPAALEWYRKAALQGESDAILRLGEMYYSGKDVSQDYIEAEKWYRMGAERGLLMAQEKLGDIYYEGLGVRQDYAEAMRWYLRASGPEDPAGKRAFETDESFAHARFRLGEMYYYGRGTAQDYREAARWFSLSAKGFNADAAGMLGDMYYPNF